MPVDALNPPKPLPTAVVFIGRLGYLSKSIVYILIGVLALLLAIGVRKDVNDSSGALQVLADSWYGKTIVILIGIGLVFYAIWKFVELCYDPKNKGNGAKALFLRAGAGLRGVLSLLLAVQAFYIAGIAGNSGSGSGSSNGSSGSGSSSGGSGSQKSTWTAELMSHEAGRYFVMAVGIVIVLSGLFHGKEAVTDKFLKRVDTGIMDKDEIKYAKYAGRFGYGAWCVNAVLIGSFVITAAYQSDPKDAANAGFSKTIRTLQDREYGRWLIGIFAVGVIAYGIFHFFMSRYYPVFTYNSKSQRGHMVTGPDAV